MERLRSSLSPPFATMPGWSPGEKYMPNDEPVVYVVDDDPAMRKSLRWLIGSVELKVEDYDSAQAFLEGHRREQLGCLVLDVRMPGMSGLDLQKRLLSQNSTLPIIIITGHGDVSMAVSAMKSGALDFIEKPFSDQALLDRIQQGIETHRKRRRVEMRMADIDDRLGGLSPRELDVMNMVVDGNSNKAIAARLGLSPKTVEVHRARVMEKMRAKSLPDLVKLRLASRPAAD